VLSKKLYSDKIKRAVHLLFFRRGKMPGVRGRELKMKLGKDYKEVISQLNDFLKDLDLEVKEVRDETSLLTPSKPETAESRFLVSLRGSLTLREARMTGWRIDNLAGLTVAIAYIISKQGKAPRKDVERILAHKFGRWRAMTMMDAFIRSGYLSEDESELLSLGWRTKAEVDLRSLMTLLLEAKAS
jgi:hypothetical protein